MHTCKRIAGINDLFHWSGYGSNSKTNRIIEQVKNQIESELAHSSTQHNRIPWRLEFIYLIRDLASTLAEISSTLPKQIDPSNIRDRRRHRLLLRSTVRHLHSARKDLVHCGFTRRDLPPSAAPPTTTRRLPCMTRVPRPGEGGKGDGGGRRGRPWLPTLIRRGQVKWIGGGDQVR
jgi:hypothetical protein